MKKIKNDSLQTGVIVTVARASNVATIEMTAHGLLVNDHVLINASDNTFDVNNKKIDSVPDADHFTYAQVAGDVSEVSATGDVGLWRTWVGQPVEPGTYYTILPEEEAEFATDLELVAAINSGDAVANDGNIDLLVDEGLNLLQASKGAIECFSKVSHGLAVGNVVRHGGPNPEDWVKAQADSAANSQALGIVTSVSGNKFDVAYSGARVPGLSGLTVGVNYLSAATAGEMTTTEPAISKPVFFATSTSSGIVMIERGLKSTGGITSEELFETTLQTVDGAWIDLNGLSTTPAAGVYFVTLSVSGNSNSANGLLYIAIGKAGSEIAHTERVMEGTDESSLQTQAIVTVNGAETIAGRTKESSASDADVLERNLILIKLG
jgi:hypothetical protein